MSWKSLSCKLPKIQWKTSINHQSFLEVIFSGIIFLIILKFLDCLCLSASVKEAHYLNKKFCNIGFNNFWIIFSFMYNKHELIIDFIFWTTFFRHIYKSFEKYSKQNLKITESSKSFSTNRKKVKPSKLAQVATTKTTLKFEWKKNPFVTSISNDISP